MPLFKVVGTAQGWTVVPPNNVDFSVDTNVKEFLTAIKDNNVGNYFQSIVDDENYSLNDEDKAALNGFGAETQEGLKEATEFAYQNEVRFVAQEGATLADALEDNTILSEGKTFVDILADIIGSL